MPTTTLNFQVEPIEISASAPSAPSAPTAPGTELRSVNTPPGPSGPAAPRAPVAPRAPAPLGGGPYPRPGDMVLGGKNPPPALPKSVTPSSFGSKVAGFGGNVLKGISGFGAKVAGGVAGAIAADLLFPESVGAGSDMVGGKPISGSRSQPQTKPQAQSQAKTQPRTRSQPQTQSIGREDPFAPIPLEFDTPTPAPFSPAPYKPPPAASPRSRSAVDFEASPGTGTITLAPIDPRGKPLSTPSLLDSVTEGGVNLLTPIVDFLKKLDLDIQQIKQGFQLDFSPLLRGISEMINPIVEMIAALPETFDSRIVKPIMEGIVELLTPIAGLTATTLEGVIALPQLNAEIIIESVAPILLGLLVMESLFENLTETIKNLNLKMQVAIPQGLAMQMEVPQGLAMQMEVPQGLAMQMEVPQGLAMQMEVPQGLAMQMEVPQGLAMQMEVPQGLAMQMEVPQGLAMQMEVPQGLAMQVEVPQSLSLTSDLSQVDTDLKNLKKLIEKTTTDLDKCCKDIQDKLKKKKKDDDDRFPTFKNSGQIECDGVTIPYNYSGVGLSGLYQQNNVILGISKMMLKKVCDNEIEFPLIQGGGTFVCDETFGNYNYSGVGLLGLQSQIDRVLDFNRKILSEVCDDDEDIFGSINFTDCDGGTQVLLYNGDGLVGLSSQVTALAELQKLTYAKACETSTCMPVQPGDEFAELNVPRQLVLTWGEQYPTQSGSLWHTQIPNPREDLEWCADFDNLVYTKGNVYGRWLWGNSKIKSGMRCVDKDEADRILDLISQLSTSTGRKRFTIGGGVKLNPAVRSVRCVRAAIAELGPDGIAVTVKCFVPPIEGC
jgi:hypothetical protein